MAYRNPRFYFEHALRRAGAASIGGTSFDASYPLARVYDSAISRNGKFGASAANQYVKLDRGAGFGSLDDPDTLIIPSGHNLGTATLEVRHHTSDPPDGVTGTTRYTGAQAAGLRVLTFTGDWSFRYGSITVTTSGQWEFGELWLTKLRTTTTASPDPDWTDGWLANMVETKMRSAETYRLELARPLRYFRFRYHALSSSDLAVFTDMQVTTRDGLYPLWVDPPDDTETTLFMRIIGGMEFKQDHPVPGAGATYSLELRLVEELA